MGKRRKQPTLREKLASALLYIPGLIPPELRDSNAKRILKEVQWHHIIPVADGGLNDPGNLQPMLEADHEHETRTKTVPTLYKNKRIRTREREHKETIAEVKLGIIAPPKQQDPSWLAPPKPARTKRKLQGRGFQGSRKFNGQVKWRTEK